MSYCPCEPKVIDIADEETQRFICTTVENSIVTDANDVDDPAKTEKASTGKGEQLFGLVYKERSLWPEGKRYLKVKFLGDISAFPNTVERIKNVVTQDYEGPVKFWSQICCIDFKFVTPGEDAEIRIVMRGDRMYESEIGVDALDIPQHEETMSLGFDTDDYDDEFVYRAVLHEFGHVLGFDHEHQSPKRTFEFDKAKVTEDLKAVGWTDEDIKENFFDKITVDEKSMDKLIVSDFDASSIMEYDLKASWLINYGGRGIEEKNVLSVTDILKAAQAYRKY